MPDHDEALEEAARALRTDLAQARFVDPQLFDSEDARITARKVIAAHHGVLVRDLPERAVKAAGLAQAPDGGFNARVQLEVRLRAFLGALTDSGGRPDEG